MTLTPIAEHLALELSLSVFTTLVCRGWDANTQTSARGAHALTHCATTAVYHGLKLQLEAILKIPTHALKELPS